MRLKWILRAAASAALLLVVAAAGEAQIPTGTDTAALRRMAEQQLGGGLTQQNLAQRLQQSGLTRSQVQARLQQMGYDPSLVDQYFDAAESGSGLGTEAPSPDVIAAMRALGVVPRLDPARMLAIQDSLTAAEQARLDSARADSTARGIRIFGQSLFDDGPRQFDPVMTGPVSSDYRLGPGDELWLILTGDVERSYPLTVTREGFVVIPQVGQVPVFGLTLEQLEDRLYTYLGRAYSGVRRGADATTHFQVSMGALRVNHVFVIGEVENPSGYDVSAMARSFNALYRAGGPSDVGSFRNISVRRDGREVATVDLYPYLLAGDASSDVRLEQGDVVFVPVSGPRVRVKGAVRRPATYEVKAGETLRDVLAFAGGFEPDALVEQIKIDRILSPAEREPGRQRVLLNVDVSRIMDPEALPIPVRAGDVITVDSVSERRRNRVAIRGGVRVPGEYEWDAGLTLRGLIDRAQGLREGAYASRAHIHRLQPDNTRRLIQASLAEGGAQVALADLDSVVVFTEDSLRLPNTVSIRGYVKETGEFQLSEGMTLRDLVLTAGGFTEGAYMAQAEVARPTDPLDRSNVTAQVVTVPLAESMSGGDLMYDEAGIPSWRPESDEFVLRRGDRVYIRRAPGYQPARAVQVTGEIEVPGIYELGSRDARLSEILGRAGGVTAEAYLQGLQVVRGDRIIAGDHRRALQEPGSQSDILLQPGDSIHVPDYDGTVLVTGAVLVEARVQYRPGYTVDDYVERAGGYADNAAEDRAVVTHPNGEREVVNSVLLYRRSPRVQPGSEIFIPISPESERGVDWDALLSRTLTTVSTLLTIMLALDRLGS